MRTTTTARDRLLRQAVPGVLALGLAVAAATLLLPGPTSTAATPEAQDRPAIAAVLPWADGLALAGAGPGGVLPADAGAPATPPTAEPDPPTAPDPVAAPTAVEIPSIGVDASLVELGLAADRAMEVPDFGLAGWYVEGPAPGDPGPAVIAAHVDSYRGPDVFHRLRDLQPGDEVIVHHADGSTSRFAIDHLEQAPKDELPGDRIWAPTDEQVLRLITCGGAFDRATGHYLDNVIAYASAIPQA